MEFKSIDSVDPTWLEHGVLQRVTLNSVSAQASRRNRLLGGFFVRRDCWILSSPVKLLLVAIALGAVLLLKEYLHPFLAITHRVQGEYLVVEGWVPPYCLKESAVLLKNRQYQKVFTTGCPAFEEWGARPNETYAELAAERLIALGADNRLVQPVPSHVYRKDRTYYSALALKDWCASNQLALTSFDVLTCGPHARRTWLLYQKAFGDNVKIGVIAVEDQTYDPSHWWASSEGFRDVVGEAVAYFYARVLFHPSKPDKSG